MIDFFDPNTWDTTPHQFRMFAGVNADYECLVDEEDYLYFTRWLWVPKTDRTGKVYFRRSKTVYYADGSRSHNLTVYLHVEILTRAQGEAPTRARCIVDHLNGDNLDNRRSNLRWVTKRINNQNRFGSHFYQREMHV